MNLKCQKCGNVHQTVRSDRSTWACPVCYPQGAPTVRFTIDPRGARGFGRSVTRKD